jgi:hypothetical protein
MYYLAFLLIGLFRKVIEKSGANYQQVKTIVKYKITMDNRKSLTPTDTKRERNYAFLLQLMFYFIFGLMFGILIGSNPSLLTSLFVTFAFLMMLSAMNMIADFSTLLLDTRDNTIIIPRPVTEQTFLLARIFHISTYILSISLAFSVVPLIAIIVKFNILAAIVFFAEVLMSTLFSIFLTHIFYLSLMKYTSGERFKDIIAYFQTGMTILFMGGYQLLPKYIQNVEIKSITNWKMLLAPPTWLARATEVFTTFQVTWFDIISIFLGIAVPMAGIWLVIKVLAPGYLRKLVVLEQGEQKKDRTRVTTTKRNFYGKLAAIFTKTSVENTAFQTIWKLAGRDREFKQSIFAMIGSLFILVFIMVFKQTNSVEALRHSSKYLFLIYAPFFFLFSLVANLRYSHNFKSAWIYAVAPISKPGEIISGSYKALIIKIFIPVFLICNSLTLYFWGIGFVWQVIAGLFLNIVAILVLMLLFKSHLPFSHERKTTNTGTSFIMSLLMFGISFGLGGIHYLLVYYQVNVIIVTIIMIAGSWVLFNLLRNKDWKGIESLN